MNDDYDENFARAGLPEPIERRAHERSLYVAFSLRYSIWIIGPLVFTWLYPHWFLRVMFEFGFKVCETCGTWMMKMPDDMNYVFDCGFCIYGDEWYRPISVFRRLNWMAVGGWLFVLGYVVLMICSMLGLL